MKIDNHAVKIAEVPPLHLLDLRAKIEAAKRLYPDRLGTLHARYSAVMKQIREEKHISIKELSALCGSSEEFLAAAESGNQMTDDDLETLHGVYWALATGEENPGDFKRLANERLATPYPEFGYRMREIREQKELTIQELSTLSGVPVDILESAESGNLKITGDDLADVQKVYWSLAALEASPADYRRLLADISMEANAD